LLALREEHLDEAFADDYRKKLKAARDDIVARAVQAGLVPHRHFAARAVLDCLRHFLAALISF